MAYSNSNEVIDERHRDYGIVLYCIDAPLPCPIDTLTKLDVLLENRPLQLRMQIAHFKSCDVYKMKNPLSF